MTPREWMTKHGSENGRRFAPKIAQLIDEEKIPLAQAMELSILPPAEQELFAFEAANFTVRSLKSVIRHWNRYSSTKQEEVVGILDDINAAFDAWNAWAGNEEDPDQHQEMVARTRGRVLAYIHGLRPPPSNKVI